MSWESLAGRGAASASRRCVWCGELIWRGELSACLPKSCKSCVQRREKTDKNRAMNWLHIGKGAISFPLSYCYRIVTVHETSPELGDYRNVLGFRHHAHVLDIIHWVNPQNERFSLFCWDSWPFPIAVDAFSPTILETEAEAPGGWLPSESSSSQWAISCGSSVRTDIGWRETRIQRFVNLWGKATPNKPFFFFLLTVHMINHGILGYQHFWEMWTDGMLESKQTKTWSCNGLNILHLCEFVASSFLYVYSFWWLIAIQRGVYYLQIPMSDLTNWAFATNSGFFTWHSAGGLPFGTSPKWFKASHHAVPSTCGSNWFRTCPLSFWRLIFRKSAEGLTSRCQGLEPPDRCSNLLNDHSIPTVPFFRLTFQLVTLSLNIFEPTIADFGPQVCPWKLCSRGGEKMFSAKARRDVKPYFMEYLACGTARAPVCGWHAASQLLAWADGKERPLKFRELIGRCDFGWYDWLWYQKRFWL